MTESASHVSPATLELLGLPSHQRIRAIRSERWVSHPRVQKAIQLLEQILDHPHNANALDRNFWRLRNGQNDVDAEILYRSSARRRCRHRPTSNAGPSPADDNTAWRAALLRA